jgi:hypothetical protein
MARTPDLMGSTAHAGSARPCDVLASIGIAGRSGRLLLASRRAAARRGTSSYPNHHVWITRRAEVRQAVSQDEAIQTGIVARTRDEPPPEKTFSVARSTR